jgi:hypothetical protein
MPKYLKENKSNSKREFQSSIPSTKVRTFPSSGEKKKEKKKKKNPLVRKKRPIALHQRDSDSERQSQQLRILCPELARFVPGNCLKNQKQKEENPGEIW